VNTPPEMIYRMTTAGLGQAAQVTRLRSGEEKEVSVQMIEAPDVPARDTRVLGARDLLEGTEIARINPAVISEFNLTLEARGVVVIDPNRLGRRVGLRRGDVIEAINGEVMDHPDAVAASLRARYRSYDFTVLRGNQRLVLKFRV